MTDKELLYIKTIAEEHNITKAAEKLHVAQPSLTQCIKRIEKSLDCPLFYRKKAGLVLTDGGKLYYETACRILKIWDQFSEEISNRNQMNGGKLTIGASWYNTILILTRVLGKYSERYPNVDVRLVEKNSSGLAQQLEKGELDLVLVHQYPKEYPYQKEPEGKSFVAVPLVQERFLLAAHEKFSIPVCGPEQTADLKHMGDLPLIRFSDQQRIRRISDFVLEQAGAALPTALTTYGFPSVLDFVAQGVGAAILPELYLRKEIKTGSPIRLYPLDPDLPAYWTSAVCYYQSEYMPVTVEAFLELLKEEMSRL